MKSRVIFISFLLIVSSQSTKIMCDDLVEVIITPKSINSNLICESILYSITNNYSDTIVTFSDVFIEGLTDTISIFPLSSIFAPNLALLKPTNNTRLFVDGYFEVFFYEFPNLLVIPPGSTRVINLNAANFKTILISDIWNILGIISVAHKYDVDTIVTNNYSKRYNEYVRSLLYQDTVYIYSKTTDSINSIYKNESLEQINLIKDAFKFRYYSK